VVRGGTACKGMFVRVQHLNSTIRTGVTYDYDRAYYSPILFNPIQISILSMPSIYHLRLVRPKDFIERINLVSVTLAFNGSEKLRHIARKSKVF
jgi:hypothetical protein